MTEPDFVPFVPRRAGAAAVAVEVPDPPVVEEAPRDEPPQPVHEPQPENDPAESVQLANNPAADLPEPLPEEPPRFEQPACDHRREIRDEAIRLAAIACGRALRHAIALHPKVLARFVDDAIAAAGHPQQARIRLQPDAIAAVAGRNYDCIADDALGCGEVVVELGGASIGASIDDRAELLVRSAAER